MHLKFDSQILCLAALTHKTFVRTKGAQESSYGRQRSTLTLRETRKMFSCWNKIRVEEFVAYLFVCLLLCSHLDALWYVL